ncbi:RNI-like protein [Alternaria alternata]|nr:RNI-like protein [Alternaria alternata]
MYRGCTTQLEVSEARLPWVETSRLRGATLSSRGRTNMLRLSRPSPSPAGALVARPHQRCASKDIVAWWHTRQAPPRRAANS